MVIEAKASKTAQEPAKGKDRFAFANGERLTRLPLYVAMAIVGIAAYLKTMLQSQAATASSDPTSDPPADGEAPENWCLPGDEFLNEAAFPDKVDTPSTGSVGDPGVPDNQVGRGQAWPRDFVVPDLPPMTYIEPPDFVGPTISAYFPAAFGLAGVNDNILAAPQPVSRPMPIEGKDGDDDEDNDEDDDDERANRAPIIVGPVRLNDVFAGQIILIGLSELIFGATDPDGDALSVHNVTVTGTSIVRVAEGWRLTTEPGMLGPVTISYRISDGETWVAQTARLDIVRNTQVLTPGDDVHSGMPYDDDIDGMDGDDIIDALAGNDLVVGGRGDDHINGGDGDDDLSGGEGHDVIFGGRGNDVISGGGGHDRLFGGDGDDTIDGDDGHDYLFGGAGNDIADGGPGDDHLAGEAGDDILEGGDGRDVLDGGAGADVLLGGDHDDALQGGDGDDLLDGEDGNDQLFGGSGDDTLTGGNGYDDLDGGAGDDHLIADAGNDSLDGGDGADTLDYSAAALSVVIDMVSGTVLSAEFGEDTFENMEQVMAGAGDDMFIIGATATIASGGRGRDTFVFDVTDENPMLSEDIVHDILDFVVGDRIRVRDYDIDREAQALEQNLFRAIYDDDDEDWLKSDLPIVVQHVRYDDVDNTIIRADIDHDDIYEITIYIHGILLPIDVNATIA
jgi:Ca2+-binding RTX toxin-like protein